jgi:hypothetical protein
MWPFFKTTGDSICLGRVGPLGLLPYSIPVHARNTHMYVIGTPVKANPTSWKACWWLTFAPGGAAA